MRKSAWTGYLSVLASAVIFGFTPVLAALSYQGGNNGVNMAFLRALLPIPLLTAVFRPAGNYALSGNESRAPQDDPSEL